MRHLYSRSSPSAVRHATDRAINRSTAPKPWKRLRLQQGTPGKLSILQRNLGLVRLARALRRKDWECSLRGCLGPKAPWGWQP